MKEINYSLWIKVYSLYDISLGTSLSFSISCCIPEVRHHAK